MTPERWGQIEELFHRAAECDPRRRSELLDEACSNDPELRREVEALLSHRYSAGDHLQAAVRVGLDAVRFPLVGETISHYRILDGLGGGGMGVVYRAEDIKLGRRVALKFLPEDSAKDSAALGRFEREARAASALEHPNICPIYEFGEHEGQPFLVMQLLEGQTLRELISAAGPGKPPLPLDRLLDLAVQIADGLDAAHRHGIIHRDIKPANIFVTTQGQAKILDFGLAKLSRGETAEEESEQAARRAAGEKEPTAGASLQATPDPLLSRTGVAMGTAGYMSPEQALGEKLDARTDLFSFGLVLYEMATGQSAFNGDTGPVLRDAILKHTATSPSQLNSRPPAKLGKIINKALEKDREARYQSAAEIRTDLQSLKRDGEHGSRRRQLTAGAVALLLVTGVIFWYFERRQPPSQAPAQPKLRQLTVNSYENRVITGAISPDGKYLAYTDINGMYIKLIETGAIRTVPQPEGLNSKNVEWEIVSTAWFPDSARFLANAHPSAQNSSLWTSQDTSIWMVSVLGGAPHKLRDKAVAYSVSPDGALISFGANKGSLGDREIWLMAPNGERERKVLDTDEKSSIGGFLWLPNGQGATYFKTDERGDSFLSRDLKGGLPTTIFSPSEMKKITDISWLPDGRLLFSVKEAGNAANECNYWTIHLDPRTGQLIEKARQLTNWTESCVNNASVTADGKRLAFLKGAMHLTSYMADLAAGGTRILNLRHFPLSESSVAAAAWTPDSKQLLNVSTRVGNPQLYKQPLDEETEEPLVTEGYDRNPQVTPDGKWVLYLGTANTGEPLEKRAEPVLRVPIDGGPPQKLFTAKPSSLITCARPPSKMCAISEPSEDRTQVIVDSLDPMRGRGPELTRFAIDPNGDPGWAQLSPDGTRIVSTGSPPALIYILSLRGQPTQEIKVEGWSNLVEPTWAADGRGLYVSADSRGGKVLLYVDLQGNARVLWEGAGATAETLAYPSPDGHHLVIQTWTNNDNMWMMENF